MPLCIISSFVVFYMVICFVFICKLVCGEIIVTLKQKQ